MICHLSKRERIKVPLFFSFEKWDFTNRSFSKRLVFAEQIRYVHNRRELSEKRRMALEDFDKKVQLYLRQVPESLQTGRVESDDEKVSRPAL